MTIQGTPDPLLGQVLDGRWRIDAPLGAGGMGTVYRARQLNIDRPAAIKIVNPAGSDDALLLERFATEAHVIANLHHPHILRLFDVGQTPDGRPWIAMELLEGEPLSRRLRRGPLPVDEALRLIHDVADALVEAHGHGIIHRDLKPANIFVQQVGDREVIKVLDFGIARVDDRHVTATGNVPGTPAYLSPEQARGEAVTAASDLYSLGVVAYECLTGALPFPGPSPIALIYQHIEVPPPPFEQRTPGLNIPDAVERLVLGLLAKNVSGRPVSAAVLRNRVDALRIGAPGSGNFAAADPAAPRPTPRQTSFRPSSIAPEPSDGPPTTHDGIDSPAASTKRNVLLLGAAALALGAAAWVALDASHGGARRDAGVPALDAATVTASTASAAASTVAVDPAVHADAGQARADAAPPDADVPDATPVGASKTPASMAASLPEPQVAAEPERPHRSPRSGTRTRARTPSSRAVSARTPASAAIATPASAPPSAPASKATDGLRRATDDEFLNE